MAETQVSSDPGGRGRGRGSKPPKAPKPSKFKYVAENLDGESVSGVIEAPSSNVARNELAVQGLRVHKLTERRGLQFEVTTVKVPPVDVMHFCRQMATFLRAGVPILEALDNLRMDAKNRKFREVLDDVINRVGEGDTFAGAIAVHADVFPPYMVPMLRSAEFSGRMDETFEQLHTYLRRDIELSRQVRKALIYPAILMVASIVVVTVIVVFVIPKFAEFFESFDAELPATTRMLTGIADFVGSTAGVVTLLVLVAVVVLLFALAQTTRGRRTVHSLLLKIPLLRQVIVYSSTERFTRVLGALLDSGVALSDALPAAVDCSNNVIFAERLGEASVAVLEGEGFAGPLQGTELFPPTVIQMVRVGERTGELSEQLDNVASFYEDELEYAVEKLTSWFEPVVILVIGVVVGFVALAMVSAMYGIYGEVDL